MFDISEGTAKDILVPFLSAIAGAAGSVAVIYIQTRDARRRDLVRLAVEIAEKDRQEDIETAKKKGGGMIPPIAMYINLHAQILSHLVKGPISPKEYTDIYEKNGSMGEYIYEKMKENRKK